MPAASLVGNFALIVSTEDIHGKVAMHGLSNTNWYTQAEAGEEGRRPDPLILGIYMRNGKRVKDESKVKLLLPSVLSLNVAGHPPARPSPACTKCSTEAAEFFFIGGGGDIVTFPKHLLSDAGHDGCGLLVRHGMQ